MNQVDHPLVDNGEGYPTSESVHAALEQFNLGKLAGVRVSFKDHEGPLVDMVTQCRIEHLTENWPKGFISQVIASASQAAEGK